MKNKRIKTQTQHAEFKKRNADKNLPQIFEGISFHVNGITDMPHVDFDNYILLHGGIIFKVLDRKGQIARNGFIIASSLTPTKRKDFAAYRVVTEDFVLQSCWSAKLLDWRDFTLKAAHEQTADEVDFLGQMPTGSAIQQKTLLSMRTDPPRTIKEPPPQRTVATALLEPKQPTTNESSWWASGLPGKPSHKAAELLLDESWRTTKTAVAPDFIEGYYKFSRLHHLSQWKADLPQMVARLLKELIEEGRVPPDHKLQHDNKKSKPLSGTPADNRTIFHVDFDCFFTSASLIARPDLRGQPAAVCHAQEGTDGSTSEIASCSYEARAFGVKNGMSLGKARQLCPDIQPLPYDFVLYSRISETFYKILLAWADQLQAVSCDECYIDISSKTKAGEQPLVVAEAIRDEIRAATGCEVSIGSSFNMVLARLATSKAKPASAYHLTPDVVLDHLGLLGVADLPGVGWATTNKLAQEFGVKTLGDVLKSGQASMQGALGPNQGIKIFNFAKGIDPRQLEPPGTRKSVSVELNYAIRFINDEEVQTFMFRLSTELVQRMKALPVAGKSLTLKVMQRSKDAAKEPPKFLGHGPCDTFTQTHTFSTAINDVATISNASIRMIQSLHIPPSDLRGIALQMTKLEGNALELEKADQQKLQFKAAVILPPKIVIEEAPVAGTSKLKSDADPQPIQIDTPPRAKRPLTRSSSGLQILDPPAPADVEKRTKIVKQERIRDSFAQTKGIKVKGKGKEKQATLGRQGQIDLRAICNLKAPRHDKITDAELAELGIPKDFWDSLPGPLRIDVLTTAFQEHRKLFEQAERARIARQARGYDPIQPDLPPVDEMSNLLKVPVPEEPRFRKQTSIEAIRPKIEEWVKGRGTSGPAEDDMQRLTKFFRASLRPTSQTDRGPNLEKVTQVLEWWHWCIVQHAQGKGSSRWQKVFSSTLDEVNKSVVDLRGRKLYLQL